MIAPQDIENLGNPYKQRYSSDSMVYARNIWDMKVFKKLLFLGAGNSSNKGPASNAGRVPLMVFNPKNGRFKKEGVLAEEQIDIFRTIDHKLYVPGHDATEKWTFGNFYKRTPNGTWKKYRNIPNALHVYDITTYNSKLFVGLGMWNVGAVGVSNDNGARWDIQPSGVAYARVYSFLKVENKLYATKTFTPITKRVKWKYKMQHHYFSISEYGEKGTFNPRPDINVKVIFPNTFLDKKLSKKIVRTQSFGDKAIYLGANITNDHQSDIFGVYVVSSLEYAQVDIEKVQISKQVKPFDILIKGSNIYVLGYNVSQKEVIVLQASTKSPTQFKELLHFSSSTFARSFEMMDNAFYFGLGCEVANNAKWRVGELDEKCGDILRIKKSAIKASLL